MMQERENGQSRSKKEARVPGRKRSREPRDLAAIQ